MAFTGQFEYSLDAKNRLTIPAQFRASFSDGVVLAKHWLDPCIAVFTPDDFQHFMNSFIGDMHALSPQRARLQRFFGSGSFRVALDAAGRVTLNSQLMEHAGVEKDVVIVGNTEQLEIWNPGRYAEDQAGLPGDVARIAESFGNPS